MVKHVKYVIFGAILGISNVIPGVSAGTMAVILKIYDKILDALSLKGIKKHLAFLLVLAAGMAAGILLFARPVSWLFDAHLTLTSYFFIGVILGSLPMLLKKVREGSGRWWTSAAAMLLPLLFMLWLGVSGEGPAVDKAFIGFGDPGMIAALFVCGVVSAFSMVIPGVSGSMILLALGYYQYVMLAIKEFNIPVLMIFGAGCAVGVLTAVAAMKQFLKRFHRQTYCAIIGLIVGSIYTMYQPLVDITTALWAVLLLAAGVACSLGFDLLDARLSAEP